MTADVNSVIDEEFKLDPINLCDNKYPKVLLGMINILWNIKLYIVRYETILSFQKEDCS
jgi:hypothetical protein